MEFLKKRINVKLVNSEKDYLTTLRMDFFVTAHAFSWNKGSPVPKICYIYSTMMKLGILVPYLKKAQKICKSPEKSLKSC